MFWTPCQASKPGDLTKRLGISRESGLEGQQDLITGFPKDWGKQRLQVWRVQTKFCMRQDQRRGAVTPQEIKTELHASGGMGWQWLTTGIWALEGPPWHKPSWSSPLTLPQTQPWVWVASGQATTREGLQPHSSADNWIKALLGKALPTRAVFPTASPSHQEAYTSLSLIHERADRRNKKKHSLTAAKTNHVTES